MKIKQYRSPDPAPVPQPGTRCTCLYIFQYATGANAVGKWPKQGARGDRQGGLASGVASPRYTVRYTSIGQRRVEVVFRPLMWLCSASVVWRFSLHLALAKVYLVLATALLFFGSSLVSRKW